MGVVSSSLFYGRIGRKLADILCGMNVWVRETGGVGAREVVCACEWPGHGQCYGENECTHTLRLVAAELLAPEWLACRCSLRKLIIIPGPRSFAFHYPPLALDSSQYILRRTDM